MSLNDKKNVCPLCGSNKQKTIETLKKYNLNSCLNCQMVWEKNPPGEVLKQYSQGYFINENPKGGYSNYFSGMQVNRKTFSKRLEKITKKFKSKESILDVGCALGDCLLETKKIGFKTVMGIDPSSYACEQASKRGLTIIKGTLKTAKIRPESFEIVLSQDEIEHLTDPVEELKRIYKILKPGGLLFLVTPDIEGFWSKLLKKNWYHYKPNEHLIYFSKKTIFFALKQVGFVNIKIKTTSHIMSLEYILNRLKYYLPLFFKPLHKLSKKTFLGKIPIHIKTDELEAWAEKPTNQSLP